MAMRRIEKKLFVLNDRLAELRRQRSQVEAELNMHRHINDDAQRDAAGGHAADRAEAHETAADVARFERHLRRIDAAERRLEQRRRRLLGRLNAD